MALARLLFALLIFSCLLHDARAACDPRDEACKAAERRAQDEANKTSQNHGREFRETTDKSPGSPAAVDPATEKNSSYKTHSYHHKAARPATGKVVEDASDADEPLQPVRAYLRARDIPPTGAGAYGIVVLQSRPTAASQPKLMMVCQSFVAHFPTSEGATAPLKDQMITVWPLDNPDAKEAKQDDCGYVLNHYDLAAAESAVGDAERQQPTGNFGGSGPYLVGWSPSKMRGVPDALVLVVDMSSDNTQAEIDHKFDFWKTKIVEDPTLWRNGFAVERFRVAVHNFADRYGQAMLDAIKLIGSKSD